ncbi:RNA polymerase sigma factor [Rhizorhabdus argentea]|uniref:RNA polymerase sigma factor n=1 Tax=Rhizorhabdus argentea TaxID=1387174 RepID=UPI0030ED29BE
MSDNGLKAVFLGSRPALMRFLAARGAGADAEDLLQELWLKASAAQSGPIASPLAYLYRMADNLMLDRRREAQRRLRRDDAWSDAAGGAMPGISDQPSAERVLLARERLRLVDQMLEALGDRTAAIFRSHRIDGVAQRDIAATMGISLSAVEKHLQKAYRVLVQMREGESADLPPGRRHASEGIDDVAG